MCAVEFINKHFLHLRENKELRIGRFKRRERRSRTERRKCAAEKMLSNFLSSPFPRCGRVQRKSSSSVCCRSNELVIPLDVHSQAQNLRVKIFDSHEGNSDSSVLISSLISHAIRWLWNLMQKVAITWVKIIIGNATANENFLSSCEKTCVLLREVTL